ncbi:hypothetical protein BKA70DRAFT_1222570 [Coprinopsis sp. MPI-PUGE-AT-0042]|nr:hypothetical protein BKA70DRAFT_1222570 [Coprinopsis sp. MPI-PUGE-AT-0042]
MSTRKGLSASESRKLWKKRKESFRTDPLYECGKLIAQTVNPFVNLITFMPREIKVAAELERQGLTWFELPQKDRLEHQAYLDIAELLLLFGEELRGHTLAIRLNILTLVTKGQADAWKHDGHALRSRFSDWLLPFKVIFGEQEEDSLQGFSSQIAGGLLCPVILDWSDDSVQLQLRSKRQTVELHAWPRVLYQEFVFHREDEWDGFLQSGLLVKCFKRIHNTPHLPLVISQGISLSSILYVVALVAAFLSQSLFIYLQDYCQVLQTLAGPDAYARGAVRKFSRQLETHLHNRAHRHSVEALLHWWTRYRATAYIASLRQAGSIP